MRIWRVKKLAAEFRDGSVSEIQQFLYLIVNVGFTYVLTDPFVSTQITTTNLNQLDTVASFLSFAIFIVGTYLCFNAAIQVGSAKQFVVRYICLSLPVAVRALVLMVAIMFTAFIVNDFIWSISMIEESITADQTTPLELVFSVSIQFLFYYWLREAIKSSYA